MIIELLLSLFAAVFGIILLISYMAAIGLAELVGWWRHHQFKRRMQGY